MMCYSLYIWHMYGINLAGPQWPGSHTPYAIFLVFLLSAFTYRYIEFPRVPLKKLFAEFAS
jgi:peptidoglycan/LPS O-acetylase OafA/YrhL